MGGPFCELRRAGPRHFGIRLRAVQTGLRNLNAKPRSPTALRTPKISSSSRQMTGHRGFAAKATRGRPGVQEPGLEVVEPSQKKTRVLLGFALPKPGSHAPRRGFVFRKPILVLSAENCGAQPGACFCYVFEYVQASRNYAPKHEAQHEIFVHLTLCLGFGGWLGFGGLGLKRRSPTVFSIHCFCCLVGLRRFGVNLTKPNRSTQIASSQRHEFQCTKNFPCQAPIFMIS